MDIKELREILNRGAGDFDDVIKLLNLATSVIKVLEMEEKEDWLTNRKTNPQDVFQNAYRSGYNQCLREVKEVLNGQ